MKQEEKETFLILRGWQLLGHITDLDLSLNSKMWAFRDTQRNLHLIHWRYPPKGSAAFLRWGASFRSWAWTTDEAIEYENSGRRGEWITE
jgi:hypothetical protein